MMSSSSSYRDWGHLPLDLLVSVAQRLHVLDHILFAAVCTSWRSAASFGPLAPRMPYLLIGGGAGGRAGEDAEFCTLVNLAENRTHRISPLPEIRGKWFLGSQDGWIATFDHLSNIRLLNPLSRSQIDLPPLTTLSSYIQPIHDSQGRLVEYLCHENKIIDTICFPNNYTLEEFRRSSIYKIVLSSSPSSGSNYTVVAIFHFVKLILYIRPGENKWNLLDEKDWFMDAIYYKGKLLTVAFDGYIVALDLTCDPPRKTIVAEQFEPHPPPTYDARYLVVDCRGNHLLQVCRLSYSCKEENMFKTNGFVIMQLDLDGNTWYPLKSLGNQSLFLGNSYSIALSTEEIPGLKENCIYFTDDNWELFDEEGKEMTRDVGVYNLEDDRFELIEPPCFLLKWPPPIWIKPTPWRN